MKKALYRHQNGDVDGAIHWYESVTLLEPSNFEAHYRLGLLKAQRADFQNALVHFGHAHLIVRANVEFLSHYALAALALCQFALAITLFEEIHRSNALDVEGCINFAHALRRSGELGKSLQIYTRAFILDPSRYEPVFEMGSIQFEMTSSAQALISFENALQIAPTFLPTLLNQAMVFEKMGCNEDAMDIYEKVLNIDQGNLIAIFNLAHLCQSEGQHHKAHLLYLRALTIQPDHSPTHLNLSALSLLLKDFKNAEKFISQFILLAPDHSNGYFNFGVLFQSLRKLHLAKAQYKKALALKPEYSDAWSNLGDVLYDLQRSEESIAAYRRALVLEPSSAKLHYHLSQALLLDGQFDEGWMEFEWRARLPSASLSQVLQLTGVEVPQWDGRESLKGKRLLVLSEQGLGDVIQFLRFLKTLCEQGAILTLMAPQALLTLLKRQSYIHQVIEREDPIVEVDLQCSLMSLPFLLGTERRLHWEQLPYIEAPEEEVAHWKSKMKGFKGPRVGLVWSGGFRAHQPHTWAVNQRRNIALKDFLSLMTQGCTYFSLQKGELAERELQEIDKDIFEEVDFVDWTHEIQDFSDTAAMIKALDLVISVDTSTAHLAAAMGKQVWLLNRFDTCWRWLLNRDSSSWYREMYIYRQETPDDWSPVLGRVNQKLKEWVKNFPIPNENAP